MFLRKGKMLLVGKIDNGVFNGSCSIYDINEQTVYLGTVKDNMKEGYGYLVKYKT